MAELVITREADSASNCNHQLEAYLQAALNVALSRKKIIEMGLR